MRAFRWLVSRHRSLLLPTHLTRTSTDYSSPLAMRHATETPVVPMGSANATPAPPHRPPSRTWRLSVWRTYSATVETGEPTFGGLMTKTVWGAFSVPQASRVVIHTVGSDNIYTHTDLDTVSRPTEARRSLDDPRRLQRRPARLSGKPDPVRRCRQHALQHPDGDEEPTPGASFTPTFLSFRRAAEFRLGLQSIKADSLRDRTTSACSVMAVLRPARQHHSFFTTALVTRRSKSIRGTVPAPFSPQRR